MRNMKRFVAVALAATMVLGSSLTAFADETNTGNSTGAGTSEGHVDKKATNVVLPTVASGTTPFAYTMDPERLIVETSHEKYGNAVEFPTSTDDTGVYFNNGAKGGTGDDKDNIVYANSSKALDVVNKSSHSIDLTVKAEAVAGDNDIPLVEQDDIEDAEEASIYLGLKVGSAAAEAVLADTAATKTVSIAGTPGNFKTAVKTSGDTKTYEYRALTADEWKDGLESDDANKSKTGDELTAAYDATWAKTSFNLEGEVTEDLEITASTTAPSVKVTWSWVDPSANAAPSAVATQAVLDSTNNTAEIAINLGLGDLAATGVTSLVNKGAGNDWIAAVTVANGKISFNKTEDVAYLVNAEGDYRKFIITFNDTAKTSVEVALTVKE